MIVLSQSIPFTYFCVLTVNWYPRQLVEGRALIEYPDIHVLQYLT